MFRKLYWFMIVLMAATLGLSACGLAATPTPAASSLTDEEAQTLLIGLGQIRGHLLVSLDIYKLGDPSTSAVHAAHPVVEVFGGIATLVLEKPGQAEKLKGALEAYIDALNTNQAAAGVEKAHAEALAAVEDTAQSLAFVGRENTVEFLGPVVLGLLDIAGEEYEEAVVDGKFENTIEYQDASGFVRVAKEWYGLLADDLKSRSPESAEKLDLYFDELSAIFPAVTPPAAPAPADEVALIAHESREALAEAFPAIALAPQPHAEPEPDPEAPGTEAPIPPGALVIYSGRSEPLVTPVIEAFKARYPNVEVVLKAGSNSALANALLEEQGNPQADLFITTEVFTVKSLHAQGVFADYVSAAAANVPANYKDPNGGWTGVTLRARVIMYNTDFVSASEAPGSILELADPNWAGQVAAANSANGSLQAQAAVMQNLIGGEATEAWLTGLLDHGTTFLGGHTDVRKAVGAGEFKLGLVNHYYYYLQKAEGSPVGIVFPDQGAGQMGLIVNASAVGVVRGGPNTEAAQKFVDFLLSPEGQELFASLNFEYPILPGVPLHPDVEPLANYRLADVNLADGSIDLDTTLDLLERVGIP